MVLELSPAMRSQLDSGESGCEGVVSSDVVVMSLEAHMLVLISMLSMFGVFRILISGAVAN